jgi:uncharacterized protein
MGVFVITKRSNGEFQFNLKADNGKVILTSEGYSTKQGCKDGIDSVKSHAPSDANYERKTSSNDQYYFNLKAGNGKIIGTSEMYVTAANRDAGIETVKANAPDATVDDQTL